MNMDTVGLLKDSLKESADLIQELADEVRRLAPMAAKWNRISNSWSGWRCKMDGHISLVELVTELYNEHS